MIEHMDPTGGWAKSSEAIAKTTGKAIDVASDLGRFVSGPFEQVVGMITDRLQVARLERQVRLSDRVHALMKKKGLSGPTSQLPLSFGTPLLTNAAIEEDDYLQDRWAHLLVNSASSDSNTEQRRAFISILQDLTALDVQVLAAIASVPGATDEGVWTQDLPNTPKPYERSRKEQDLPPREVQVSIYNLIRAGCVVATAGFGGGMSISIVTLTPLGEEFVRACTE